MSELNFRPELDKSYAADRAVAMPALDAGVITASHPRLNTLGRMQRRRLKASRLQFEDTGFRLFRVY